MKTKLLLILLLSLFLGGNCPTKGDSDNAKHQQSDLLKNRSIVSKKIINISLDSILKQGDDTERFNSNSYVSVIGYICDVKYGGEETCNCHSKDKSQLDIHIEIVKDLNDFDGAKRMIIEVNRYVRAKNKSMNYDAIKLLKNKKVKLSGWLFFDEEHKQNAINTSPNGTNNWRATCWEIHPCMEIKEVK